MKVFCTPEVTRFVAERGGLLFVWADKLECCSNVAYLETSTESPGAEHRFVRLSGGGFQLLFDGRGETPNELHLDVKGWPTKRVRAYWDGHAYAHGHPVARTPSTSH